MKKRVYIETSIPSYLTARPSRDLIQAARQQITNEWWEDRRREFDLFVSQYVLDEAGDGDIIAAKRRLEFLDGLPLLETTEDAIELGEALITEKAIPQKAVTDALHIAIATVHEMNILLTWNCKHLANAEILEEVTRVLRSREYNSPVICTPDELMGE
jgi:predicted nucleic acid-binding protein